jgi:hypothetical protein
MTHSFKHVLPMLAALAVAPLATAAAQGAQLGLEAGVSMAKLTGDVTDDLESNTAFLVGGFAAFQRGDLTIQPGVYFTRKGMKFSESGAELKNNLDYLQIPVLFKFGAPMGTSSRFYIGAGPAIAFQLGCKFVGSGGGISASVDCEEFNDDEGGLTTKSTEFSGIGVAGIEFGKFAVGLRADIGFTNVYGASVGDVDLDGDLKTQTLSLVGSIKF